MSGEVADVVARMMVDNRLLVRLVHCKFYSERANSNVLQQIGAAELYTTETGRSAAERVLLAVAFQVCYTRGYSVFVEELRPLLVLRNWSTSNPISSARPGSTASFCSLLRM